MLRLLLWCGLCLLLAGCRQDGQAELFKLLRSSNLGLGLAFDMAPSEVVAKLGQAQASESRLGGMNLVDYYLPESLLDEKLTVQPVPASSTPQLAVSYFDGKLRRLYNKWIPGDDSQPEPPFFIELVKGVKLGARKSDLTDALGSPVSPDKTEWQFKDEAGFTITITATFMQVASAGAELCDSLLVVYAPPVAENRGEDMKK
jgi:hypothetical protein